MNNYTRHLIRLEKSIREALEQLNDLAKDAILFAVDDDSKLKGALTDGDVRRGLIRGVALEDNLTDLLQPNPKFIRKGDSDVRKIIEYRESDFKIIPVLDKEDRVINVINFSKLHSYLPLDAVIMAGGIGKRLQPLTINTPKPLLKVGDKPIIEHNLNRLTFFGIDDFWISIKYLGEQIVDYLGDGAERNVNIQYVRENEPLGTIGAVSKVDDFQHDHVLVTNSDLLTNLDYEHFFLEFINQQADMAVVTIPYQVDIPYAVLETDKGQVKDFKEKPTYTYYSNGGIYLIKREILELIPSESFFNATDLMEKLINEKYKVISYPLTGYWLDIGKHEDYQKAQEDIKSIKF